jgi:YcaO-like protein with predicted kinase domain
MDALKIRLEGAQRACTPKETISRMMPHFHVAGITRVSEITGLDRVGIPVAQCIRPSAQYLSVDSGKGATAEAAICSAIMEGFERHVGENFNPEIITAPLHKLSNAEFRFPLLDGAVYNTLAPIRWCEARGIVSQQTKLVPYLSAALAAKLNYNFLETCFHSSSNGLSSGNTLHEAIAGALYEIIERDQVRCAFHTEKTLKKVNFNSIKNEVLGALIEKLKSKSLMTVLFDCTGDIKIPTYTAYIYDSEQNMQAYRGYATHLDPEVAQCRAVCEAVQSRLVYLSGSRDDIYHEKFTKYMASQGAKNLEKIILWQESVDSSRHEDCSTDSFEKDIQVILQKLSDSKIPEPLIIEIKHPYPCSVVKILIPTLEGYIGGSVQYGGRL